MAAWSATASSPPHVCLWKRSSRHWAEQYDASLACVRQSSGGEWERVGTRLRPMADRCLAAIPRSRSRSSDRSSGPACRRIGRSLADGKSEPWPYRCNGRQSNVGRMEFTEATPSAMTVAMTPVILSMCALQTSQFSSMATATISCIFESGHSVRIHPCTVVKSSRSLSAASCRPAAMVCDCRSTCPISRAPHGVDRLLGIEEAIDVGRIMFRVLAISATVVF